VSEPVAPQLEFVTKVTAEIAAPIASGRSARGLRQMIPITGGALEGPRLSGRVLPGGADFQIVHADGIAHAAEGSLYFRSVPRFETASERLRWLMTSIFVASARPLAGKVELDFFRVR
jgi:hypothetical protein